MYVDQVEAVVNATLSLSIHGLKILDGSDNSLIFQTPLWEIRSFQVSSGLIYSFCMYVCVKECMYEIIRAFI
jgi:hypothetical protein